MNLYSWDYTINHNENEKRSHRYNINRPTSRHGHYSKYRPWYDDDAYMY